METFNTTEDEKLDIVLNDPKFGMFSLMKYHILRGYRNEELKKDNTMYCTHIFSLYAALPVLVYLAQWFMYIALIANEYSKFDDWAQSGGSASQDLYSNATYKDNTKITIFLLKFYSKA